MSLGSIFRGKKVLVTGGTGSIGSEIVKALLALDPDTVRIFTNSENELFNFQQELLPFKEKTRFLIGDVRSKSRLRRALRDIDVVFHAAALKHVPLCEYNPFEAVKTNIMGTSNLINVASEVGVELLVNISTDKAVNPINVVGASKLLAEKLVSVAKFFTRDTVLYSVRFGNVLWSRGSLLPIIHEKILKGEKIPLTDEQMTRFVMTIPEAVQLVLKTTLHAKGGEVFVLKMPKVRVLDFIEAAADFFCEIHHLDRNSVEIEKIGKRPGEKLSEALLTPEESEIAYELEDLIVLPVINFLNPDQPLEVPPQARKLASVYDSADGPFLTREEILRLLRDSAPPQFSR
ncbi:MAG: SDR family NAD(P)-dependent oxidoreductase [Promethearchaeota archaeon]